MSGELWLGEGLTNYYGARYGVTGVPKTLVDDDVEVMGALPEAEFVAQVLRAGE